jgi:hypothetical protein
MNRDESPQGNADLVSPGGLELPGADSRASRGRTHRRASSAYHSCERLTEAVLFFAVVFNPWVFGTTQEWAIWFMNIAGHVLGALLAMKWLVRLATGYCPARWPQSHSQSSSTGSRWLTGAMAVLTILFLGYVLVSAVNARALFSEDARVFTYFQCIPWLPHSYDRAATWFAFWQCLGLACMFWASRDWLLGMSAEERRGRWGQAWQDDDSSR